jgi:hypothetical protein
MRKARSRINSEKGSEVVVMLDTMRQPSEFIGEIENHSVSHANVLKKQTPGYEFGR